MAAIYLLGRCRALRVPWEPRRGPLPARALQGGGGGVSPTVRNARHAKRPEAGVDGEAHRLVEERGRGAL